MIEPLKSHEPSQDLLPRINEVIEAVNNQRRAIESMAIWLVQAQTGFGAKDAENIAKILDGTMETEEKTT